MGGGRVVSQRVGPVLRGAGAAPWPMKVRSGVREPPSPRLKAIAETVAAPGNRLAGSAMAPVADCAMVNATEDAGSAPADAA